MSVCVCLYKKIANNNIKMNILKDACSYLVIFENSQY